jgi:RTA1 like protein
MSSSQDVIALTIQGVGGGLAASAAASSNPNASPNTGGNIMLGGIVFQLVAIIVYLFLALEFIVRFMTNKPFQRAGDEPGYYSFDNNLKSMLGALMLGSVLLLVRYVSLAIQD